MIKAILFDFAGVIGVDGYWVWLRENVADINSRLEYFEEISDQVDKSIITNKEFVNLIAQKTGINSSRIWPEIYNKIVLNQELLVFMQKLRTKYKIGLLSNFTHEWLEEVFNKNNLSLYFDSIYISSRYGMIKPEAGAFRKALELLSIAPQEAIFVDDRQVNVDAAKRLGMRGFLYTSFSQLKKDFKNLGVTI